MQQVFKGDGSIKNLSLILEKAKSRNLFIVRGKGSFEQCGAAEAIYNYTQGFQKTFFSDFSPNPTHDEALRGAKKFKENKCDLIIAIGGGSTIDIAKTINAYQAHLGSEKLIATNIEAISNPLKMLIAIPTTAGTGSEATHFAVCYVDGKKYSIADQSLLPEMVILDPQFTHNLPKYITACTGFDALCQGIESCWAKGATSESRAFAFEAIELLISNLKNAVINPTSDIREKVLVGAHLAGKAINISKTTAPHALSYKITSDFDVPHGHAVALLLGKFFILNQDIAKNNGDKANSEFLLLLKRIFAILGVKSAEEAENSWYQLMIDCELETDLQILGVDTEKKIDNIINDVNVERLTNHPVPLTYENMKSLFRLYHV